MRHLGERTPVKYADAVDSKAAIGSRRAWEERKAAAPALRVGRPIFRSDHVKEPERAWMVLVAGCGVMSARDALIEVGIAPAKAAGIAAWLQDQLDRRRVVNDGTASAYRHELARVGAPRGTIPGYINSAKAA